MSLYRGGVYNLGDGTLLQDIKFGCGLCQKKLAEVIHDPSGCWRTGDFVCLDCGLAYAPARMLTS